MTKVAIIEDESDAQLLLSSILEEYCPEVELVGVAGSFDKSIQLINTTQPDVIFFDIQLEDCNAFQILETFEKIYFQVIFTTAYDHYAIKAFEFKATHYLLKPYAPNDVIESLSRIKEKTNLGELYNELQEILKKSKHGKSDRIGITTIEGVQMIDIGEIVRIEADRSYSTIFYLDGQKFVASKPLKEFENSLPEDTFFRTHASHLVNLTQISKVLKYDGGEVILKDGTKIPLARRRKKDLLEVLTS